MIDTILGTIGTVLGVLSYLRDRTHVIVQLRWDMEPFGWTELVQDELYGFISIANMGRRPIFLSHVHIVNLLEPTSLIIPEIKYMSGQSFSEIDKPLVIPIKQKEFNKHSNNWYNLRACITDLSGKEYYSKLNTNKPSWGTVKFNVFSFYLNYFKFRIAKLKIGFFRFINNTDFKL